MPASFPTAILGNLLQVGTVTAVDAAAATCKLQLGDLTTGPLPWLARAGQLRSWAPPSIGEQCLLLSPEGDMRQGVVLPGLYSNAHPAPATDANRTTLEIAGSLTLDYDAAAKSLRITLADGSLTITAPDGIAIAGDVAIAGDLDVTGGIAAGTDVEADGISLIAHHHLGVQPGSGETGAPA